MTTLRPVVIEDNGGGLHLYVVDDSERCVWGGEGFEFHGRGSLVACVKDLAAGADPKKWDGGVDDPQSAYDAWDDESRRNGGWRVICDESGPIDIEAMGAAGAREFSAS